MNNYYIYYENKEGNFRVLYNDDSFETLIYKPKEILFHYVSSLHGSLSRSNNLIKPSSVAS